MWNELLSILQIEIFAVDGQPMSLGKFLMGIFLLAVVYFVAGRMSNMVDRRILHRFEIDNNLRRLLHTIVFYFILAIGVLFVLRALNIPITIFTVIGGALAIGIGFGSQNVVNNFMSSMIVLIEKPVRVGDFIEVDGFTGVVDEIGIRSTKIISAMNQRIVLPNSTLIEKPLVNWNLTDDWISATVRVGVGYESNIEVVKNLMIQAAKELKVDFPGGKDASVLLVDFGDNAIIMDLAFWCKARRRGELSVLQSHLREKIWQLFQQNKISIPFPQREVVIKNMTAPTGSGSKSSMGF